MKNGFTLTQNSKKCNNISDIPDQSNVEETDKLEDMKLGSNDFTLIETSKGLILSKVIILEIRR